MFTQRLRRYADELTQRILQAVRTDQQGAFNNQAESILSRVRAEYTVMPRFGFHQPLDYHLVTLPPDFEPRNQDGEVSAFLSLAVGDLIARVEAMSSHGEFTIDSAIVSSLTHCAS